MDNSMKVPLKIKNRTSTSPEIPLLCIYLEKNMIQKDTCTWMFITALFTIAKTRKQPVSVTEEQIQKKSGKYM